MKKITLIFIFIAFLISCEDVEESNIYKYSDIYYQILVVREKFPDTALANPKVNDILAKNGYSQISFQKESFELFEKDKNLFTKMIDSVRKKAESEIKRQTDSLKKIEIENKNQNEINKKVE